MTHEVLRWIIRKKVDPKRHRKDVIESQRDREYMETLYGLNEAQKGKKVHTEILDTLVSIKRELNQQKRIIHEQATEIKELNDAIININKKKQETRNKPKGIWCAYRGKMTANAIITYDKIFHTNTNQDMPGLDINTG